MQVAFPKAGPEPAAAAASRLLAFYPSQTPNSPKEYMAAVISLLAEYPREVIDIVCDPRRGIATRCKFLPTLAEVSEALKSEMEPHNRAWAREREKRKAAPRRTRPEPTKEERERVQKISESLKGLGSHDPIEELRKEARRLRDSKPQGATQ